MKFLSALALSVLVACGGANLQVEPEIPSAPNINTDKTLQLVGRGGVAQGCPVEGVIYTAAHVVQFETEDGEPRDLVPGYAFSTVEGNQGIVRTANVNIIRDLAVMYASHGAVNYYKLGETPARGDKVYWREYDFDDDVLAKNLVEAEVSLLLAGHVVMTDTPETGASGGCLFNEDGEVIGVVVWSIMGYGVAVSITGYWNPFK